MGHSTSRKRNLKQNNLKKKNRFCALLAFFISNIVGNIFEVVSYQKLNLGIASFSCKRSSKSIA